MTTLDADTIEIAAAGKLDAQRLLAETPEIARRRSPGAETLLLDQGADIDATVPHFDVGCTPLHQSVVSGHLDMTKLLAVVSAHTCTSATTATTRLRAHGQSTRGKRNSRNS